tara:strand:- start:12103 stop:12594 length:492 start_codon:yes stop_codon:yes gene_type:complete
MDKKRNILDYIKPVETKMPKKDYFAGLALQIAKNEDQSIGTKSAAKIRFIPFAYAAAAVLMIGFVLFQQFNVPSPEAKSFESYLAELSPNEIIEYVESNIEDYSEDEIIDASAPITEEEMTSSTFTDVFGYIPEEVEKETIEEYLDEDFINLNDFDENELLIF